MAHLTGDGPEIQMDAPRILIVEDDAVMSMHLETLVGAVLASDVVSADSVAEARVLLARPPDFALLDVDVLDGKTYDLALWLRDRAIPFVFVSASDRTALPRELRDVTFVAKPYDDDEIVALLESFARDRTH